MQIGLLAGLGADDERAILSRTWRRRFRRGEVLFHEGDLGDTFHFLVKGRVAVRVTTPNGDVAMLTVLGPGASFGVLALLDPANRRTATVAALEPAETLALHSDDFRELCNLSPVVEQALMVELAGQVRRLSGQLAEALYTPADQRLLRRLLDLHGIYGAEPIPLSQEDLATMAGTTRSTANRVLRRASERGVISLGRSRLTIVDEHELRRLARP